MKNLASVSSICLDLKPPYATEVVTKLYPVRYVITQFQKLDKRIDTKREHVARFIDSMGACANYVDT